MIYTLFLYLCFMKRFLQIFFLANIILLVFGYYIKADDIIQGNRYIGIAVVVFAFVFLPLFLYYRYKGRTLKEYTDLDKLIREHSEIYPKDKQE